MSIPTVEATINELMDWAWHDVEELLAKRGLLGGGLVVEDYTGLMSWLEGTTRYTVVHSPSVAVLFVDTVPVDAIRFHRVLLGADDPKSFFTLEPRVQGTLPAPFPVPWRAGGTPPRLWRKHEDYDDHYGSAPGASSST